MVMIMLLGGFGVWDLNDDDNVGTISIKNKMVVAMIYHPLLMIFLIKVMVQIEPVISELRSSRKWTVDGSIPS